MIALWESLSWLLSSSSSNFQISNELHAVLFFWSKTELSVLFSLVFCLFVCLLLLSNTMCYCLSFPTKPATISNIWCLEICAGTLFVMLPKFGAVLSIICGFLMAIYTWIHLMHCIVVVRSFLRMLKLCKLVVRKLYLLRGGGRTRCQVVLDYGLNLHQNIPLICRSMIQMSIHFKLKSYEYN